MKCSQLKRLMRPPQISGIKYTVRTVWSCKWVPIFRRNMLPPSSEFTLSQRRRPSCEKTQPWNTRHIGYKNFTFQLNFFRRRDRFKLFCLWHWIPLLKVVVLEQLSAMWHRCPGYELTFRSGLKSTKPPSSTSTSLASPTPLTNRISIRSVMKALKMKDENRWRCSILRGQRSFL
jgi:hypothetical protein